MRNIVITFVQPPATLSGNVKILYFALSPINVDERDRRIF